ncbi:hypothetical protein RR46_03129 [Papilio xuthus]|uniref:F-box domain-containing protein n=1 Tax=Papilio xuthus TaxID=66420 RepID=A0A194Q736_PAPXU|nr:hypothetical protein RR46_03129 [Papilio xuthus]
MQITDLPVEIVVVIVKKLDIKSVHNLYETCSYFKNVICMYSVVKTAKLALSTAGSVHFLKQTFMKDISRFLQTLDLRGIGDLRRSALQAAVREMKCLITLDVSYTNIDLLDFYEVYKVCPTIKNVACNFVFHTKKDIKAQDVEWQGVFQNFDKVHFVGNAANLWYSNLCVWMLAKACLSQLQLTIIEKFGTALVPVIKENDTNVHSKYISICILDLWNIPTLSETTFALPSLLRLENIYECVVIIKYGQNGEVYASPRLLKFLECYNAMCIKQLDASKHVTNGVIMLWNKSQTVFDDMFFKELKGKMMKLLPHHITDNNTVVPQEYDYCFLTVPSCQTKANDSNNVTFKKQRLAPECPTLDYDTVFSNHKTIHLTMFFPSSTNIPVTLSLRSQYLRKLKSLYLTGNVMYSMNFFSVLFSCCEQLETLNVEASPYLHHLVVLRDISQSHSLKNLRLINKHSHLEVMFSYLSKCSTLENIHIVDFHSHVNTFADPSPLFERCHNLYCISICADLSDSAITRANQLFKKLKTTYGK